MSKSKRDVESCKLANCNCIKHWARADPAKGCRGTGTASWRLARQAMKATKTYRTCEGA